MRGLLYGTDHRNYLFEEKDADGSKGPIKIALVYILRVTEASWPDGFCGAPGKAGGLGALLWRRTFPPWPLEGQPANPGANTTAPAYNFRSTGHPPANDPEP